MIASFDGTLWLQEKKASPRRQDYAELQATFNPSDLGRWSLGSASSA
jgi:hypothetical protein